MYTSHAARILKSPEIGEGGRGGGGGGGVGKGGKTKGINQSMKHLLFMPYKVRFITSTNIIYMMDPLMPRDCLVKLLL